MPLYGRFRGFFVFCVCVRLATPPPLCGLVSVKKARPPPTHPHLKIVDNSRLRPAPKVAVSRVFQGFSRRLPPHPALSRISQISCLPTGAFEGCTSITAVVIPDGVTEIQDNAFYDCTSLETVTIPSSVTLLRNCAFCDCPNLRAVYFKGDAPQQSNYVFDSTENVTMYYQDGTSGWENPWHGRPAEVYIPE